jgi:hypothetical protein
MVRQARGADEVDAFSRWGRKYLAYIQRPGVRKSIKRKVNRRERREAKGAVRDRDAL